MEYTENKVIYYPNFIQDKLHGLKALNCDSTDSLFKTEPKLDESILNFRIASDRRMYLLEISATSYSQQIF